MAQRQHESPGKQKAAQLTVMEGNLKMMCYCYCVTVLLHYHTYAMRAYFLIFEESCRSKI